MVIVVKPGLLHVFPLKLLYRESQCITKQGAVASLTKLNLSFFTLTLYRSIFHFYLCFISLMERCFTYYTTIQQFYELQVNIGTTTYRLGQGTIKQFYKSEENLSGTNYIQNTFIFIPSFETKMTTFFKKWAIPGLFFFIFVFSIHSWQ